MPDGSWCIKGGARGYVTTRPLEWWIGKERSMWIGKERSMWILTVPSGREFESSVPRGLRWLFSPDDPHFLLSACIHDTLLEHGFRQAFADSQWFEAAMSEHAPPLRVWLAYSAMRTRRFALWSLGRSPTNI